MIPTPVPLLAAALVQLGPVLEPMPSSRDGQVTIRASAEEMLALADELMRAGREEPAAKVLSLLMNDPRPAVRNEARFRRSQMLGAKGNLRDAALLLRRILDDQPNAPRVRLELAALLQKLGDEQAAFRELRALRSADLPPNVARFVDRLTASLQASKPMSFQLELAVAPDSNINRATRSETLGTIFGDFQIDQEKRSGVGATIRGMAQRRIHLGEAARLVGRVSAEANLYRDKDFNDVVFDIAAGPEVMVQGNRLATEAGVSEQWFGMQPYQRNFRLAGSIARPLDPVSQLRLDAAARWSNNKVNDLLDGRGMSLRARYERALSPSLLISASTSVDRFKARDAAYSTRSWTIGLAAYREVGRMTFSAGFELGRLKADDRLALLPYAREDKLTRFQVGTVLRQFTVAGFAPMTRLIVERNKSSVEFYDYGRNRVEFGVSRAF